MVQKTDLLYSGKAKSVYLCAEQADQLILHFRNDTSAFDGQKLEQLPRKGLVNNQFNAFIMQHLALAGIPTHFLRLNGPDEAVVKRLTMIPIECVVRNVTTGSLCRRLGVAEGLHLDPPLFEFFLKNDELHDPMVNDNHILAFGWATAEEIQTMKDLSLAVNTALNPLFEKAGLILVDYKLEFGRYRGQLVLGDEFTPDGCRIWDIETKERLDKDRFRRDLGQVVESYELVAQRLGITISETATS